MDTTILPPTTGVPELDEAHKRHLTQQARIIRDIGWGDTSEALAIAQDCILKLTEAVLSSLKMVKKQRKHLGYEKDLTRILHKLDPSVVSLCILQTALRCIAEGKRYTSTLRHIGAALSDEAWAVGLTEFCPRTSARIDRAVRTRHSSLKYRKRAASKFATKAGYVGFREAQWNNDLCVRAGNWGLDLLLVVCPDVFVLETDERGERALTISWDALSKAQAMIDASIERRPVLTPLIEVPKPWTGWSHGAHHDHRVSRYLTLMKTRYRRPTEKAVREAIASGAMQPALDALNALQAVPWTINKRMLGIIRECAARGIHVGQDRNTLPSATNLPLPERDQDWEDMSDDERRLWRHRVSKVKATNRAYVSERCLFTADMKTAECLSEHERFYTPMNMDWRGRIYAIPSFNFAREDRVRALFAFADGMPLGDEGLYWLKVHVANCGDFDKISKRPFEERVKWVDDNLERINEISWSPLSSQWWTQADKPFLFLAAALDLVSALETGTTYVSHLPVSFDGSCSGLQHLCAMTRAAEGLLVNLTPNPTPQDVYQVVADRVYSRIVAELTSATNQMGAESDVCAVPPMEGECAAETLETAASANAVTRKDADPTASAIAKLCLDHGITRKVVKRNVMTYSYSSKQYGMAEQQREDLMRPLDLEVLEGKRKHHPFASDLDWTENAKGKRSHLGNGVAASKYLANHVYASIEDVVHLPAQAMAFLQKIAKVLAHEGKPVRWTTPDGIPWVNRYHEPALRRITLFGHDQGVRVPYKISIATGHDRAILKDKAANGISPNFVHALDASHLRSVVRACVRAGMVSLATVHDSFGCHAAVAGKFRQIILQEFVRLYTEHDPLTEVLEQAKCDLTHDKCDALPEVPTKGPLNLMEVLNAPYAFA